MNYECKIYQKLANDDLESSWGSWSSFGTGLEQHEKQNEGKPLPGFLMRNANEKWARHAAEKILLGASRLPAGGVVFFGNVSSASAKTATKTKQTQPPANQPLKKLNGFKLIGKANECVWLLPSLHLEDAKSTRIP